MELPFITYTVRILTRGTGAHDISLFASPLRHQGYGLSNTRVVEDLAIYILDILSVTGIKSGLERIGAYLSRRSETPISAGICLVVINVVPLTTHAPNILNDGLG